MLFTAQKKKLGARATMSKLHLLRQTTAFNLDIDFQLPQFFLCTFPTTFGVETLSIGPYLPVLIRRYRPHRMCE